MDHRIHGSPRAAASQNCQMAGSSGCHWQQAAPRDKLAALTPR